MDKSKEVLKYCPNFYKIMEFESETEDGVTQKLINVYREYIFRVNLENQEDVELVKNVDDVYAKYIDDFNFRNTLKEKILQIKILRDTKDVLKAFMLSVLEIFENYQSYTTRVICMSRWI